MVVSADTNIYRLLERNPGVSNRALEGVIEANMVGFNGKIHVTTESYSFANGAKISRVFHVTPYGPIADFFVDLKRALVGVSFPSLTQGDDQISEYVLGRLSPETPSYAIAQKQTEEVFSQGRRFRVILAQDGSSFAFLLDQNQGAVCSIL